MSDTSSQYTDRTSLSDDDYPTATSTLQSHTKSLINPNTHTLKRSVHIKWLLKSLLSTLPTRFTCLDASKPWILYWLTHSLDLLGYVFGEVERIRIRRTLEKFQISTGGFAGGSDQIAHLAPTYAAVNTLIIIGEYDLIDREKLHDWLLSLKQPDGSFIMCMGGEKDIRASYCALSVSSLLNLPTKQLYTGVADFIHSCQGYEGGIGSVPDVESHGGYTFCGLAAMEILGETHLFNKRGLVKWLCNRQMVHEGGFQGRTNKLVDGCYSFWLGACFAVVGEDLLDRDALQRYIIGCCQSENGGLLDKPGKSPDFYHSCYCLSGLSVSQHNYTKINGIYHVLPEKYVYGDHGNLVEAIHPVYNISMDKVELIKKNLKK